MSGPGRLVNNCSRADRRSNVELTPPCSHQNQRGTTFKFKEAVSGFPSRFIGQIQVKQHGSRSESAQLPHCTTNCCSSGVIVSSSMMGSDFQVRPPDCRVHDQQPYLLCGVTEVFAQYLVVAYQQKEVCISPINLGLSGHARGISVVPERPIAQGSQTRSRIHSLFNWASTNPRHEARWLRPWNRITIVI